MSCCGKCNFTPYFTFTIRVNSFLVSTLLYKILVYILNVCLLLAFMLWSNVILQIWRGSCSIFALITFKACLFMFCHTMKFETLFSCSLMLTVSALMPNLFMHCLNVPFKILLCCRFVVTRRTVISYFFMFWLFVDFKTLFSCCFVITRRAAISNVSMFCIFMDFQVPFCCRLVVTRRAVI